MTDSRQLLVEYARNGSEAAFRELVTRYVDLVYSAAIRLVEGDAHRAEDVAQTVFTDLARMAGSISREVMLGGWLHRHACFVAANVVRGERRRRARERQAAQMNITQDNSEAERALIAPILDEAINKLGEPDRMAILLRFFEQRNFRCVGEALGSSEDAARMRVNRALDKLRTLLKRRGVTTSAAALAAMLTVGAVESAPAGLAAAISIAAVAVAGTTAATSTVIAATKTIAMTTLQKVIIGTALTAAIGTGIFEAHRTAQLRDRNQTLQQQQTSLAEQVRQLQQQRDDAQKRLALLSTKPSPRLPAPSVQFSAPTNLPVEASTPTNWYARFKDEPHKLNAAQGGAYLKANGTNAASLLAAFRTSGDPALLQEAMVKYPNDPQVAFEAVLDKNLTPEEQRQWLNAFEQDAPDNALPNYLSALNYFNSGQIDQGLKELATASGKLLNDYSVSRAENDIEAYLAAGYSVADAEGLTSPQTLLPQLGQLKQLALDCSDLASAYRQAGDMTSAQTVLQMADKLGQQYATPSAGESAISQLVGIAMERIALAGMDPSAPYGDSGQTVQDRLTQLTQQEAAGKLMGQQVGELLPRLSDTDVIIYENRWLMFGEANAEQWVINKSGRQ